MKTIFILVILCKAFWADTPQRVWDMALVENIETAEDIGLQEPSGSVEDLPLATTYPVEETPLPLPSKGGSSDEDLQQRIDQLQKVIQKSVQKEKQSVSFEQESERVLPLKSELSSSTETKRDVSSLATKTKMESKEEALFWEDQKSALLYYFHFLQKNPRLLYALLGTILALGFISYWLLRSGKEEEEDYVYFDASAPSLVKEEISLIDYETLKGKIHARFLERKQNILFHDEFTPYQRAKATLELEKEYNDIEHIQLPKLFGHDFERFLEAQDIISAKMELKEIVKEFVERLIEDEHANSFTKEQIKMIQSRLHEGYKRVQEYQQIQKDDRFDSSSESQKSYLLQ